MLVTVVAILRTVDHKTNFHQGYTFRKAYFSWNQDFTYYWVAAVIFLREKQAKSAHARSVKAWFSAEISYWSISRKWNKIIIIKQRVNIAIIHYVTLIEHFYHCARSQQMQKRDRAWPEAWSPNGISLAKTAWQSVTDFALLWYFDSSHRDAPNTLPW